MDPSVPTLHYTLVIDSAPNTPTIAYIIYVPPKLIPMSLMLLSYIKLLLIMGIIHWWTINANENTPQRVMTSNVNIFMLLIYWMFMVPRVIINRIYDITDMEPYCTNFIIILTSFINIIQNSIIMYTIPHHW